MSRITFSTHRGSSFEDAIIIHGALHSGEGTPAEFVYLTRRFGRMHLDWHLMGYDLFVRDGKFCDRVWIERSDGTAEILYFDVTAFILNPIAYPREENTRQVLATSSWRRYDTFFTPLGRMVAYSSIAAVFVATLETVLRLDYSNPDNTPLWLALVPIGILLLAYREQIAAKITPMYREGFASWIKTRVSSREGTYSAGRIALACMVALGLLVRGLL